MFKLITPIIRSNLTRTIITSNLCKQQQTQCITKGKLPAKLKRLQKLFQEKNDLPVFLKGGGADKILYYTTLSLSGLGLLLNLIFFAGYIID